MKYVKPLSDNEIETLEQMHRYHIARIYQVSFIGRLDWPDTTPLVES